MSNPILTKQRVIGFKSETTQNTPVILAPTDYILAEIGQPQPMYDLLPRNYAHETLGTLLHSVGKVYVEVKVKTELKWTGSLSIFNPLAALFKACGCSVVVSPPFFTTISSISSAPAGMLSSATSLTADWYMNGIRHTVAGCVATSAKISLVVGELAFLEITLRGIYSAPMDSLFPTTTYLDETINPPIYDSSTFIYDLVPHKISKFEFDLGLETSLREDVEQDFGGVGGFVIVGRNPMGNIDPELQTPNVYNYADKIANRTFAVLQTTLGTNLNNSFLFYYPKVQMNSMAIADRGGKAIANIPLSMRELNASADFDYQIQVIHS